MNQGIAAQGLKSKGLAAPGALIALLMCMSAGIAVRASAGELGGSAGATTDYVYRGLTYTRGAPALQADVHYQSADRWVIGAWASTVEFNRSRGTSLEIDVYAGREWNVSPDWSARLGVTHFAFPDAQTRLDYDYDEVAASLSWQSRLTATVGWTPNISMYANGWAAVRESATSYEMTATQPLRRQVSLTAGVGYYDLPAVLRADYRYWNAGVTTIIGRAQVGLMYIDTDSVAVQAFGDTAVNGWNGSLSWRF